MINVYSLPAVQKLLEQEGSSTEQEGTGAAGANGADGANPGGQEQALSPGTPAYPSKSLVLDAGRYRAVSPEK